MKFHFSTIAPSAEPRSAERGLAFIGLALILPVVFLMGLAAWAALEVVGNISAFERAALEATDAANSMESGGLGWNPDPGTDKNLTKYIEGKGSCQGQAGAGGCFADGSVTTYVWPGYSGASSGTIELPFSLYPPGQQIPGFNPTQFLPRVCVENFCSTRNITKDSPTGMIANISGCSPYCFYLDADPDIDGDSRADILFFNGNDNQDFIVLSSENGYTPTRFFNSSTSDTTPTGQGNVASGYAKPIPYDFDRDGLTDLGAVNITSGQYNIQLSSLQGINGLGRLPAYVTGSSSPSTTSPILQIKSVIALPGNFIDPSDSTQASPAGQFLIYANKFGLDDVEELNALGGTIPPPSLNLVEPLSSLPLSALSQYGPVNKIDFNMTQRVTDIASLAPKRHSPKDGQNSLPIVGDLDLDGKTEFGFISWFGGGLAQRALGLESPYLLDSTPPTQPRRIEPPFSFTPDNQFSVKTYPFHISTSKKLDDEGLYIVDPIARRVFRAHRSKLNSNSSTIIILNSYDSAPELHDPVFRGISVLSGVSSTAVDNFANNVSDDQTFKKLFPRQNLWSIPRTYELSDVDSSFDSILITARSQENTDGGGPSLITPGTPTQLSNGELQLIDPRQIRIGPDGKGYVSDAVGRIVQLNLATADSSFLNTSGQAKLIAGNAQKKAEGCSGQPSITGNPNQNLSDSGGNFFCSNFGRYNFSPLALEIVPAINDTHLGNSVSGYDLAVSDRTTIKLITRTSNTSYISGCSSRGDCGPNGNDGESIFTIAGLNFPIPSGVNTQFPYLGLKSLASGPKPATSFPLCPVVSMAYDYYYAKYWRIKGSPRTAIVAALNCSTEWGGVEFDDTSGERKYYYIDSRGRVRDAVSDGDAEHLKAGMIVRIIAKNGTTYTPGFERGAENEVELVAGGLFAPSEIGTTSSPFWIEYKDGAGADWYKPQVDLGIPIDVSHKKLREVYVHPSAVAVDPAGNVLFIQQNASAPIQGSRNFARNFSSTLYRINQYRYYKNDAQLANDRIEAISSPLLEETPYESSHPFAPYRDKEGGGDSPFIKDRISPPAMTRIGAVGAIALGAKFPAAAEIFVSSVFVNPDGDLTPAGEDPGIGQFYKFILSPSANSNVTRIIEDTDGDGSADMKSPATEPDWMDPGELYDSDLDGDGRSNAEETSAQNPNRSPSCPEIYGSDKCRWAEIVKAPTVYLFRLIREVGDRTTFKVPLRSVSLGAPTPTDVDFVEFVLVSFPSDVYSGLGSRSEDFNLTFNAGKGLTNDSGYLLSSEHTGRSDTVHTLPASEITQNNGPTVLFGPLHMVAGGPTGPGRSLPDAVGGLNFQVPHLLTAKDPDQLGFKFVRRISKAKYDRDGAGNPIPSITRSGVLCYDYKRPGLDAANNPFGLNQDGSNYLSNFVHPAILEPSGSPSSDVLDYRMNCTGSPSALGTGTVFRAAVSEALVLQVDHNQQKFQNGSSSDGISNLNSTNGSTTSWPRNAFTGAQANSPENMREVLAIKIDSGEDASRNIGFINREVMFSEINQMFSPTPTVKSGSERDPNSPLMLAVTDIERDLNPNLLASSAEQDTARYPLSSLEITDYLTFDLNPPASGIAAALNNGNTIASYLRLGQASGPTNNLFGSAFDGGRGGSDYATLGLDKPKGGGLFISLDHIAEHNLSDGPVKKGDIIGAGAYLEGAKLESLAALQSLQGAENVVVKTLVNSLLRSIKVDRIEQASADACQYDSSNPNKICIDPAPTCATGGVCSVDLTYIFPLLATHFKTTRTLEGLGAGSNYSEQTVD